MSDIFQIFELHALKNSMAVVVGTACPHAVRSSIYASVERPSVCPSMGSQQQSGSYEFAAVGLAGRRSVHGAKRANAGSATLSAYVGS